MRKRSGIIKALVFCLALSLLGGCKQRPEKHPVATLGGEQIELSEAVFYTRMTQEQWEEAYGEYMGPDMWSQEFSEEAGTFAEALKSDVMGTVRQIHLLCAHAEDYQVSLTDEEKAEIRERAAAFMKYNTPAVLEAAGATAEYVEELLLRNALAEKTAAAVKAFCEPEINPETARAGKLTYCLFSVMGTYDAEGNHTPATEQEKEEIRTEAESFAKRAEELGDIAAAGDEIQHTVIDVYFNQESDGGAHPQVAEAARNLEIGGISGVIDTEDGYYIVQYVTDYDEAATEENLVQLTEAEREKYLAALTVEWEEEMPFVIDEEIWASVRVDELLTVAE